VSLQALPICIVKKSRHGGMANAHGDNRKPGAGEPAS
jgi:hypothetical protein